MKLEEEFKGVSLRVGRTTVRNLRNLRTLVLSCSIVLQVLARVNFKA